MPNCEFCGEKLVCGVCDSNDVIGSELSIRDEEIKKLNEQVKVMKNDIERWGAAYIQACAKIAELITGAGTKSPWLGKKLTSVDIIPRYLKDDRLVSAAREKAK